MLATYSFYSFAYNSMKDLEPYLTSLYAQLTTRDPKDDVGTVYIASKLCVMPHISPSCSSVTASECASKITSSTELIATKSSFQNQKGIVNHLVSHD